MTSSVNSLTAEETNRLLDLLDEAAPKKTRRRNHERDSKTYRNRAERAERWGLKLAQDLLDLQGEFEKRQDVIIDLLLRVNTLETENYNLSKQVTEYKEYNEALNSEVFLLETAVNTQQDLAAKFEAEAEVAKAEAATARTERDLMSKDLEAAKDVLNEAVNALADSQLDNAAVYEANGALIDYNFELYDQVGKLQDKLQKADIEAISYRERIRGLSSDLDAANAVATEVSGEVLLLQTQNSKLRFESSEKTSMIAFLEEQVKLANKATEEVLYDLVGSPTPNASKVNGLSEFFKKFQVFNNA